MQILVAKLASAFVLIGLADASQQRKVKTATSSSSLLQKRRGCADKVRARKTHTEQLMVLGLGSLVGNVFPGGVEEYLGIPFAAPPGRFEIAKLNNSWPSVLNATAFGDQCIQCKNMTGKPGPGESENCLHLNIWVPNASRRKRKLPVWFWIHGGGMAEGAGSLYTGEDLSRKEDMVVVTTNYRLGALGFLAVGGVAVDGAFSTGGMNGWHDTFVALQWTKRHIAAFGGDPSKLYVGGESAGAVMTCFHLYSPLTAALGIAGVTLESGSCYGPWGPNNKTSGLQQSKAWLKDALERQNFSSDGDIKALAKSVDVSFYMKALKDHYYGSHCCGPSSVDGVFLEQLPIDLPLAVPNTTRIILGSNKLDGLAPYDASSLLHSIRTEKDLLSTLEKEGMTLNASDVVEYYKQDPDLRRIHWKFNPSPSEGFLGPGYWTDMFIEIHRDAANTCATLYLADQIRKIGATDVYLFYVNFTSNPEFDEHGYELPFFGIKRFDWPIEYKASHLKFLDMLGNFFHGKDPSSNWTGLDHDPEQYLSVNRNFSIKSGFEFAGCDDFWHKFYSGSAEVRKQFLYWGWSGDGH